jgi:hypothetical protein
VLSGKQDCRPFPRLGQPASASLRIVSFDEAERFALNQKASAPTPRWCSPLARNTVRLPSETPFAFAGIRTLHLEKWVLCPPY